MTGTLATPRRRTIPVEHSSPGDVDTGNNAAVNSHLLAQGANSDLGSERDQVCELSPARPRLTTQTTGPPSVAGRRPQAPQALQDEGAELGNRQRAYVASPWGTSKRRPPSA